MKRWRRLLFYLLLNVLVSACTMVAVLSLWDRFNPGQPASEDPQASLSPTVTLIVPPTGTASPTPPPRFFLERYVVQPGDTLGGIAEQFGITVEDLLTINGLSDPDALGSGEVLLVPVTPVPVPATPTETLAPATAAPATVTPDPSAPEPQVEIATIVGPGVLADERVVIRLVGEGEVSLLNWRLESSQGASYIFPQLTLFTDGEVWVYSRAGVDTVVELFWNREEPAWRVGATATLRNSQGVVRATYQVP